MMAENAKTINAIVCPISTLTSSGVNPSIVGGFGVAIPITNADKDKIPIIIP